MPFVLLGLIFLVFGREIAAAVFGVPALLWTLVAYRWASQSRRDKPRR